MKICKECKKPLEYSEWINIWYCKDCTIKRFEGMFGKCQCPECQGGLKNG